MALSLFPYFQPIIETSSGRIVGYEALARMLNANGGVVSAANILADRDITLQDRVDTDRSLRRLALADVPKLGDDQYISINISPEWVDNLDSLDFTPTMKMLEELEIAPHQVLIEITELSGDIEKLLELVALYRQHGMKIAIDDFGSGFSQLDRVAAFKPEIIKLDMAFFKQGISCGRNSALVRMMGDLGARMGARIICEGIETEEEFFYALECNASYMQGYFFSPAVEHFIPVDTYVSKVQGLLSSYTDASVERISRHQFHTERVHQDLLAIRSCILASDGQNWTETYLPQPEMLRLYICDHNGQQISPNYENHNGMWKLEDRYVGHHWGWRPFIYQLVGMTDLERRITQSNPYLDITTGCQCSTLSLVLDDDRVMLADIRSQGTADNYHNSVIS